MNRTDRLYALVEELRAHSPRWRSASWLADRFEVSIRTIERDLSALQQSGVPIYATPGRRGGYALDTSHTLPPLNLTAGEVTAIATALAVADGTPFTASGRSALRKILAVLRDVDADGARTLSERIHVVPSRDPAPRPPAVIEQAILQQRVLTLDYVDRAGAATKRSVEPVAVLSVGHHWYLWGWCRLRHDARAFRLDRIAGAVMHDEIAPDRGLDPVDAAFPERAGRNIFDES